MAVPEIRGLRQWNASPPAYFEFPISHPFTIPAGSSILMHEVLNNALIYDQVTFIVNNPTSVNIAIAIEIGASIGGGAVNPATEKRVYGPNTIAFPSEQVPLLSGYPLNANYQVRVSTTGSGANLLIAQGFVVRNNIAS